MENKAPVDRRVRKTKKLLRRTLLQLMITKRIGDISVTELCEAADINRGTFYGHYHDIYNLFSGIEGEILSELSAVISGYDISPELLLKGENLPIFLDTFEYLVANYDLCEVILGANRDQAFIDKVTEAGRERCVNAWLKCYAGSKRAEAEYLYAFAVSGCIGILKYWLDNGRRESAKQLAQMAESFMLQGMQTLAAE